MGVDIASFGFRSWVLSQTSLLPWPCTDAPRLWHGGQALLGLPQRLALGLRGERNSPRQRFCAETQTVLNFTPRPVITPATHEPDLSLAHANERRSYTTRLEDAIWPGESDFQSVALKFLL